MEIYFVINEDYVGDHSWIGFAKMEAIHCDTLTSLSGDRGISGLYTIHLLSGPWIQRAAQPCISSLTS